MHMSYRAVGKDNEWNKANMSISVIKQYIYIEEKDQVGESLIMRVRRVNFDY